MEAMHETMIELFKTLAQLSEQGVDVLDEQRPGAKAQIGGLIKSGAEIYAHIAMHPVPSVSLYLRNDGEDMLMFQMNPQINPRIN